MKIKFDWVGFKGGVRTAGALMLGNAFIGHLVLENENFLKLGALLCLGAAIIISTCIEKGN